MLVDFHVALRSIIESPRGPQFGFGPDIGSHKGEGSIDAIMIGVIRWWPAGAVAPLYARWWPAGAAPQNHEAHRHLVQADSKIRT